MKVTMKQQLLDHVEANGGRITWKEAVEFLLQLKFGKKVDVNEKGQTWRGWYSSYFSKMGRGIFTVQPALSYSSPNDNRYLAKISRGVYELRYV